MTEQNMFNKSLRDLDPHIWSMARETKLGELRDVYRASRRLTVSNLFAWTFLSWGSIYLCFIVAIVLSSSPAHALVWSIPGVVFLASGIALFVSQRGYSHWRVSLWEAGFLYEHGKVCQVFRWDQIESIESRPGLFTPAYKLRRRDGYQVTLNSVFPDLISLVDSLLIGFARQLETRELAIVPPRDKNFSQFKLDRQGITDKQEKLSWQDIQELTIENGTMAVLKRKADFPTHEQEPENRW